MSPGQDESIAEFEPDPQPMMPPPPRLAADPPPLLPQTIRGCLWVCAAACGFAALLMLLTLPGAGQRLGFGAAYGVLALSAVAATRCSTRWLGAALSGQFALLTLLIAVTTLGLGRGLASPGPPIMALLVCVLCAVAGWRAGAVLAVLALMSVLGVALTAAAAQPPPDLLRLSLLVGIDVIAIAAGLACGVLVAQALARSMRSALEREDRFRRLLALASDVYWEIDQRYRLVAASDQASEGRALSINRGLGQPPWELAQFGCDPETLDALLADLDTRLPFRNLAVTWASQEGATREYLLSGEPRFDDRGVFTGYWGVARDVTAVRSAHQALVDTETRYQELFSHIPTPLVLHRGGRVIDANPAALTLFGHPQLASMLGTDLLAFYEAGDSRERARRRMEMLHGQALGAALPVADFRLTVQSRPISVRATSVRVDADGGPALLAIFVDDTERLAAEEAVRRSEALLSHLVATSPDLITLTDLATGRYAMVNHSFERLSGYSAAEAVGHSAADIGLWSAQQGDELVAMLRSSGVVSDLAAHMVTKAGRSVSLLISAARFVMDRREYMVVNARDVSERERQRLEREAILANASIGIAATRNQQFVLANRHFEQIHGWNEGELIGQPAQTVWGSQAEHPEVDPLTGPALARGEPVEIERLARRRDGSSFIARIRGRAIDPHQRAGAPDSGTMWIVEDITERRQFEQALARARDDAEAASRAKSAFLANTSHELRTPLNGMIGLARLAQEEHLGEERRRQYLDQIAQSAQSLAVIISDILDLSKIEAGKLQIETTTFDLAAELRTLMRTYGTLAGAHGLELRCEIADDLGNAVFGDPLRVRQIASNFISNAIKFTASGWVELSARRLGDGDSQRVRIEVRDSGPGLDAATSARLFKPFTQADQSTTRRFGGTGLGLSICHELATLMGGSVGVVSQIGDGSTFWAELPLPLSDQPPPESSSPCAEGDLNGARVLLVEDNPVNMMIAVAMLERWGVQVTQAGDGREALSAVQRAADEGRQFDAVLMDVQMPSMSGHEATAALRSAGHALPIIALTAAALVTEREAALQAGMNDFLTKPVDAEKLRASLLRWCGQPRLGA